MKLTVHKMGASLLPGSGIYACAGEANHLSAEVGIEDNILSKRLTGKKSHGVLGTAE